MNKETFWSTVYRDNAPVLRGVLRRYVSDNDNVQDLLQETFITAVNKYESYSGQGKIEAWLYRIAINTALMHLRSQKSKAISADMFTVFNGEDEEEEYEGERGVIEAAGFTREELLLAIDRLPDHHRIVFNMYVMDDFSHKQIAGELNISVGTSKSHLARARKKIQQYLYEEALNKKKKRRRAFILFALPGNGYFIDNLFKKNLSGYTIPGHGDISFISDVLQQSLGNSATQSTLFTQAATSAGIWGSKLSYIAVCGTTAVVTTSVCWMTFGEAGSDTVSRATETPTLVVTDSAEAERKDESVYHFIDSLPEQVITEEKLQEESSGELEKVPAIERAEAEKVVIKKQRIEHKKLVIRDTVIIKE